MVIHGSTSTSIMFYECKIPLVYNFGAVSRLVTHSNYRVVVIWKI